MYAQLLIDLFKYLAPFLRNVELNKPMQILYKVRKSSVQNDVTMKETIKFQYSLVFAAPYISAKRRTKQQVDWMALYEIYGSR